MNKNNDSTVRRRISTSDESSCAAEAERKQTRLLFTQGPVGQVVNVTVACAVVLIFWPQVPTVTLIAWLASILLLSCWRVLLITRYRRKRPCDNELEPWRRQFVACAIGTAALLSTAWLLMAPFGSFEQHVLLAFIFGGLSLGAVSVLGAAPAVYRSYVSLLCVPGMLWMLSQGTFTYITMACLTVVFFVAMVFTGRLYQRTLNQIMVLSSANQTLTEQQVRLRDFADMGADLFWESDENGRFKYLSDGCQELIGVPSQKMLGQPINSAGGPPLLPERQIQGVGENAAYLPVTNYTIEWTLPAGTRAFLLSNAIPIIDDDQIFRGYRGTVRDITEQHRLAEKLKYQATHDELTQLGNRREFERRLNCMLKNARRGGSTHAVCFVDLDQFKIINDTCGHAAGDALLRMIAEEVLPRLRSRDMLARLGGDEFGILLEHCRPDDALALAHEVRGTVAGIRFQWQESVFNVTASIGLVSVDANSQDAAAVMMAADTACYAAKEAGRNRVRIYEEDDQALARRHGEMQWVARISEAIDKDKFVLLVQPVIALGNTIDTAGLMPAHYEVLVRMCAADGNLVAPEAFLPAVERYSLAARLDRWVVDAAFQALIVSMSHLDAVAMLSINLSGHSITDEEFVDYLSSRLQEPELPAHKICFEITETAAISNLNAAIGFMERLRRFGCRFALDDFGTGVSSFGYLRNLPVDYIKIDGVFVRGIVNDEIDLAMVKSIHEMGRVMGKQTVAEYVESAEVLRLLRDIGVDFAQGFAIGKPQTMAAYGIGGKLVELDIHTEPA